MAYEIAQRGHTSLLGKLISVFRHQQKMDDLREQVNLERRELAQLDDTMLRDIGVTRQQALNESQRSYFDVPKRRLDCK